MQQLISNAEHDMTSCDSARPLCTSLFLTPGVSWEAKGILAILIMRPDTTIRELIESTITYESDEGERLNPGVFYALAELMEMEAVILDRAELIFLAEQMREKMHQADLEHLKSALGS